MSETDPLSGAYCKAHDIYLCDDCGKQQRKRNLEEVAEYFCELFKRYSVNTPIDRLLPDYRVSNDDLTQKFPWLTLHDKVELKPLIDAAMRRHGLTFKRSL